MRLSERPTGWKPNPQAMAMVSKRREFLGDSRLGASVDSDTWLTPRQILSELGNFDLDPCAAIANPNWVCNHSYTPVDDGLELDWTGRVFMNPPFSNTAPWLYRHAAHGNGISLVPASVESRVWHEVVWKRAVAVLLLHGRTRFCNPDGSVTTGRPLRSISLIAWSLEDASVLRKCGIAGTLLNTWTMK